ncbi:MAG: hypothetical protein ACYC7J_07685 [Syntrophales bacterium]
MKIYTQDTSGIIQPPKKHQQGKSAVGGFDELLEKAMAPQNAQKVSANALSPLQGLSGLSLNIPSGVDRAQTVNSIDTFLNIMEAYEQKMADPRASLKDAYPLLQQMEAKATELVPTLESLPEGDKLKDILNRTLVASTVEIIKFNRGDYL